jgi:hypothetical protein
VAVNCKICSMINGKPKLIVPKWDNLEKHMGKRWALVDLPKKGQCYWDKNCKHVKNHELFVSRKVDTVLQMVQNTIVGESRRKFVQLATLFHVLSRGRPMTKYEVLQDLLKCLKTKHLPTKHWSDNSDWELAEHMHLVVLEMLKATIRSAHFIVISCDEVTLCDSGQWLSLHAYVVVDWVRVPVLLHLSKVQDQGADALTKVIVRALMSEGRLSQEEIGKKLICFGPDDVSVFQGTSNGCIAQIRDLYAPFSLGVHCCADRLNLVMEILSSYPLVSKVEGLLASLFTYFNGRPKRCVELAKLVGIIETKGLKMLKAVKTRWISMLSPCKRVLREYRPLLVKMG